MSEINKNIFRKEMEEQNMKKRMITAAIVTVLSLSTSMTAFAAPKTMPDGTTFDAEYYANTYEDVKQAFGNDENALYQHYVNHGKAEGRKPCATQGGAVAVVEEGSIKAKVAALGITYDPSRDAQLLDMDIRYWPVGDNWHKWDNWNEETQTWTYHYTRQDYTNDPLYYAFAKELVEKHDARLARINEMKAAGTYNPYGFDNTDFVIQAFDEFGGISFRDADKEYLLNMTSNLVLDYIESIMGTDLTWCQQFGKVFDVEDYNINGDKKYIWLSTNMAGDGFQER